MMSRSKTQKDSKDIALSPRERALCCARWALEKKAYDLILLQIGSLNSIAEYFLICSGKSVRQTRAVAEHIRTRFKEIKQRPLGMEGEREGCWILLDYDDVVVHVFHEPTRSVYALEKLWSDAPVLTDPEIMQAEDPSSKDFTIWEEEDWEA